VPLLIKAGEYIQYKSTKILMRIIFDFIDGRAEEVLALPEFEQLPQHVARLVLGREELTVNHPPFPPHLHTPTPLQRVPLLLFLFLQPSLVPIQSPAGILILNPILPPSFF